MLTQRLAPMLSDLCSHLAGNGGAKAAVRYVLQKLTENQFVFRTDVKSYYASIDQDILYGQLAGRIDDPRLLDLLRQYVRRTVYEDGLYEDVTQGISLGCPLSTGGWKRLDSPSCGSWTGPDSLEAAGGDPRRQPSPRGIKSPTASRQDVRRSHQPRFRLPWLSLLESGTCQRCQANDCALR